MTIAAIRCALAVLLLALGSRVSTAEVVAERPRPALAPAFDGVLTDEEYARRSAAPRALINLPGLRASSFPTNGLHIYRVDPGQQGSRLGLVAGEIITRMDGRILPSRKAFADRRTAAAQTLTVWSNTGEERQVRIARGQLGLFMSEEWNLSLAMLRSPGRVPDLDADMLLALQALDGQACDVRVCETALARTAVAMGATWPWLLAACQVELAEGRFDDALRCGRAAVAAAPDDAVRTHCAWLLYIAATRSGHLQDARDLLDAYPYAVTLGGASDAATQRAALDDALAGMAASPPEAVPPLRSPTLATLCDQAGAFTALDATSAPFVAALNAGRGVLPPELVRTERTLLRLGPLYRDGVLSGSITFDAHAMAERTGWSQCWITVAEGEAASGRAIATVNLAENVHVHAALERLVSYPIPLGVPDGGAGRHAFRIAVIAGMMQAQVDGIDVLLAPVGLVPAQRQLCFWLGMQNGAIVSDLVLAIAPAAKPVTGAADF